MGTIGVVLVIIAQGLGLSLPITAGAVVGGSYFGDKMSPLSDTTNLAPLAAGSTLYEHIQHMFYTTVPAAIIGTSCCWFPSSLSFTGPLPRNPPSRSCSYPARLPVS